MRISDWSSDVCSSDLDGPKQSELSPGISTSVNTNGHTISPLRLATHRWDSDMTISRKSLLSTFGSLVLALALSGVAVAQDSTPTSGMDKMGAMHSDMKGMHANMMGMHTMQATVTAADARPGELGRASVRERVSR